MDNMMDSINELIGSLSEEDMDALRETAKSMLGGDVGTGENERTDGINNSMGGITPEMLGKISSVMSAMNRKDERAELIAALKPHLSEPRRRKADNAMQLLKIIDLIGSGELNF